jgi:hypothetical protein
MDLLAITMSPVHRFRSTQVRTGHGAPTNVRLAPGTCTKLVNGALPTAGIVLLLPPRMFASYGKMSEGTEKTKVPRRLAAILAADIAGYSALMGAHEARTVRDLKEHQAVLLPMIKEHGGRVIAPLVTVSSRSSAAS